MKIKRSLLTLAVIPSILMSGCGEMTSDISEMIGSAADNVAASVSNNINAVYVGSNEIISQISKVLIENNTDRSMLDSRIMGILIDIIKNDTYTFEKNESGNLYKYVSSGNKFWYESSSDIICKTPMSLTVADKNTKKYAVLPPEFFVDAIDSTGDVSMLYSLINIMSKDTTVVEIAAAVTASKCTGTGTTVIDGRELYYEDVSGYRLYYDGNIFLGDSLTYALSCEPGFSFEMPADYTEVSIEDFFAS